MNHARRAYLSLPPTPDRRIIRSGTVVRVSSAVVDGLREQQKHRWPNLDVLLIAEAQAARWLEAVLGEYRARALRRAMAR